MSPLRPASADARVERIYNNNVVLCVAADGSDVVLVRKGLGHALRVGDLVDPEVPGTRRFVPDQEYRASHVAELLSEASLQETETAHAIVTMASEALGVAPHQRLFLPVLDHLSFAVDRARQHIEIDFPLQWEAAQVFPREAELGRRAVAMVLDRVGVALQDGEWSAFALHFVTYQWASGGVGRTLSMTTSIRRAFELLASTWGVELDQDSMSSARFVTHVRYLWLRALDDRQISELPMDIMAAIESSYPDAAAAASQLADLFGAAIGAPLTPQETAYLALHTSRLYVDLKVGSASD